MFIVITKNKIYKENKLEDFEKKHKMKFDIDEFKCIGQDHIVQIDNVDNITFLQDKHKIANLMLSSIYRKEKNNNWILYLIALLQLVAIFHK